MADQITAKGSKPFPVHPVGSFPAQCVDVIDLGEAVEQYQNKPAHLAHKCLIIWSTGILNPETGKPFDVRVEYSVSMGDKANLRKMLEGWRGQPYTPEQLKDGAPLHKLEGVWCQLTIAHTTSKGGNTYAKVMSVAPLHQDIRRPDLPPYTRDEYWAKKRDEYAQAAAKFREANGGFNSPTPPPDSLNGEDDDLPF